MRPPRQTAGEDMEGADSHGSDTKTAKLVGWHRDNPKAKSCCRRMTPDMKNDKQTTKQKNTDQVGVRQRHAVRENVSFKDKTKTQTWTMPEEPSQNSSQMATSQTNPPVKNNEFMVRVVTLHLDKIQSQLEKHTYTFDWRATCLPSWCNQKHGEHVSQRYRFESRWGEWALFSLIPSALSFVFLWHTHTHTHTHAHAHTQRT